MTKERPNPKTHEESGSELEQPAPELQGTLLEAPLNPDRAGALQAGLAAAFSEDQSVVIGSAGQSVLKRLGKVIDNVPRVALRDAVEEGDEPIVRPKSPEMPQRDSDSRYQLQGEIARGGMGAILKGRDTDLGRDLAIKVLLDQHKDKPEVIQRFVEEAQIGGQLQHPGIAPIYELGAFADKRPFFAMKLVKGETLSRLLGDRDEPTAERGKFIGIFEQICQTMAYAHSRGVIHRDLKPANIMVGAFGEVQVMDWGLAKVLPTGGVADEKKAHDKLQGQSIIKTLRSQVGSDMPGTFGSFGSNTQMGSVMGTPAYMPPEQALGEIDNLDERADVFGLGAILCEILTGKPPYVGEDGTQVYRMASRGKLSDCFQRLDDCGADAELIALVKHCLELEPKDRPRDAGVLAERVTEHLESVEKRLREAEVNRAAEAARAEGETRRAEAERQRAESETRRVEQQQQSASKLRKILVGLAAVAMVAVSACVAALIANNRANDLAALASKNAAKAEVEAAQARRAEQTARELARAEAAAKALAEEETLRAEAAAALARKAQQEAKELAITETAAKTLAQQEMQRAEAATELAEEQLKRFEWLLYAGKMMLAQTDFEAGSGGLAKHYLDECQMDLRGWEHRYLLTRISSRQTLAGHAGEVHCVACSPDGKRIVTGNSDNSAKIWDSQTGEELFTLPGHNGIVKSVAFSSDGHRIVTGSTDTNASVWEADTGQELFALKGHTGPIRSVAFSPDSKRILVGGGESYQPGEVTVWDAQSGIKLLVLKGHADSVNALAWSPDGKRIVTGSGFLTRVWDADDGRELLSFRHGGVLGGIWCVAISPDGIHIATGAEDGKAKIWDAGTGQELRVLKGHASGVASMAFSPDGRHIVTGSWDNTVRTWDVERGEETLAIKGHANSVLGVAFSPDGRRIVSSSADTTAKVWDAERGQNIIAVKQAPIGGVSSVTFSPDSKRVVVAGQKLTGLRKSDYTANVCDAETGQELLALEGHTDFVRSVAFSPDDRRIATGSLDKTVRTWDSTTGKQILVLQGHTFPVAFSPDSTMVATGHDDNTLRILNSETGQELLILNGHTGQLHSVAFSPDGTQVVTAADDRTARVWSLKTGQELFVLQAAATSGFTYHGVAFSPDGKHIVTACDDHVARIWNAVSGQELLALRGHTARVVSVAFSPDGQRVITGSFDKSAKLWELQRGLEVLSLNGHANEVACVAFSPDGQRAVTGTMNTDNTVRIWHADGTLEDNTWPLPDANEQIRYHMKQAELSERENQLLASEFHLRRVLEDDPENTAVRGRLAAIGHTIPFKVAFQERDFARAAQIWEDALIADPTLGDDREQQHTYNAACAAVLAADGLTRQQSEPPLDDESKAKLRRKALNWLKAELAVWGKQLESGPPEDRPFIMLTLQHWQKDPDLAGIRDSALIAKLPLDEQSSLAMFWGDVQALLTKVEIPI
jgi:WD40 repeat protein/serine/threonine protein kinase